MRMHRRLLRSARVFFACLLGMSVIVLLRTGYAEARIYPSTYFHTFSPESALPPPVRLRIPRLRMDAPVLPMGFASDGQMDAPAHADDVGWFAPGIFPGDMGSAVFSGHLDTFLGTRGVFSGLKTLSAHDDVYVDVASGETLHFRVIESRTYPYDHAPLDAIFGASGRRFLNLITCSGSWGAGTYDDRLVVFTERIE